ncbi:DUF1302 family protein [Zoogloea sp.]|uniref:DUF1302 family protein n=1 Tax=Zoogloea sp. TaxID=49181 RepID=UPI002625AD20|nr:DUF1302 family protein [Zoogloea sp.]MDD3352531.1 hypothetical protein [Zoogloea sp.]
MGLPSAWAEEDLPDLELETGGVRTGGYLQFDMARTYVQPEHWSMARARAEVSATGGGSGFKWKVSGRGDVDGVFAIDNGFYPDAVRRDQQYQFDLRETYLDFSAGDVDFRLGRQHVVWGEMVGLFFADVVSARDLRSFYLPSFDQLRIPQWAARAETYFGETHAELLWIPVPSYDRIGKPGAEFYPVRPPAGVTVLGEAKPDNSLGNTNWGGRLSRMIGGWDMSGFYYRSMDVSPAFYLEAGALQARHERINQLGGTLTKDFGDFVLKGEVVRTNGRKVSNLWAPQGLAPQEQTDYVVGIDVPTFNDGRVNIQYFARRTHDLDRGTGLEKTEGGVSLLLATRLTKGWEAEALLVSMLQRTDYMFRPKVTWTASRSWRLTFGVDVFGGEQVGLFGRYDDRDRIYTEARWSF